MLVASLTTRLLRYDSHRGRRGASQPTPRRRERDPCHYSDRFLVVPVPVVQIRGVRVRVNQRRVPVEMGVPARRRDTRPVGVIVVLVVRVSVIVLHFLVNVLMRVGLVQEDPQSCGHEPHGQNVETA